MFLTKKIDLKRELVLQIIQNKSLLEIRKTLLNLKNIGFTSDEAEILLNNMREIFSDNDVTDDLILECLDLVTGFNSKHFGVW